jgi:hypothetical protein
MIRKGELNQSLGPFESRRYSGSIPAVLVISANILIGCSGGGGDFMAAAPQFTSTPVTAAEGDDVHVPR